MKIKFSKMQGAGNDFVVIDSTKEQFSLSPENIRFLADRHFGVGADQVLVIEKTELPDVDFKYRIFNHDGGEVEQCGNGARPSTLSILPCPLPWRYQGQDCMTQCS